MSKRVVPSLDPKETPGQRPYEMIWANRRESQPPTLTFANLAGWRLVVENGAQAELRATRALNVWGRPVARLRYRGSGDPKSNPRIRIFPAHPVSIPAGADCVELWVYGNRWDSNHLQEVPALILWLRLRDAARREHLLKIYWIGWKDCWSLMHRRLPADLKFPAVLESLDLVGGWQKERSMVAFDSARFYREPPRALRFRPRPRRPLALPAGQTPGANTDAGRLEFPTREETILPLQFAARYRTRTALKAGVATFRYAGRDARIEYRWDAAAGLAGIRAFCGGHPVGALLDGATLAHGASRRKPVLLRVSRDADTVTAEYDDGTTLALRPAQKSLVVDVCNRTGSVTDLRLGRVTGAADPMVIRVPFLTHGAVLLSRAGKRAVFSSVWVDWYRSNGSELYEFAAIESGAARIHGGVRYLPRTDGARNPLFERLFLTVSPVFEEVLPVIPNPAGVHAPDAADRIWRESWGPEDYAREMEKSRSLRAHGIVKLIHCNHELVWRDGGESFTLRERPAPGRGGAAALRKYLAHQRGLGWKVGLYTNYCDLAPVNAHWSPDRAQREPDGNLRPAWQRCFALKPLAALELEERLAPRLKRRFDPDAAYTDVHTCVQPWRYNDYDARVPGAGTFAQTFYAYGELLRRDARAYGGPIFSEGTFQWMYAGLADGNYGLALTGRPPIKEPLLPVFDLLQIHPKECDIGMGWTEHLWHGIPDWDKPENIDRAVDRLLLLTLAYGHIGWLVEEKFGMDRVCRSYYMLQAVQARYGLQAPVRMAYWDGRRLLSVSDALARDLHVRRRQMFIAYPSGLKLWLNDHPREHWTMRANGTNLVLPPAGWAAWDAKAGLFSYSALRNGHKADCIACPSYHYQDGRGRWFETEAAGADGALAITRRQGGVEVIRISGKEKFLLRRPVVPSVRARTCQVFDVTNKLLGAAALSQDREGVWIEPVPKGLRYVIQ